MEPLELRILKKMRPLIVRLLNASSVLVLPKVQGCRRLGFNPGSQTKFHAKGKGTAAENRPKISNCPTPVLNTCSHRCVCRPQGPCCPFELKGAAIAASLTLHVLWPGATCRSSTSTIWSTMSLLPDCLYRSSYSSGPCTTQGGSRCVPCASALAVYVVALISGISVEGAVAV